LRNDAGSLRLLSSDNSGIVIANSGSVTIGGSSIATQGWVTSQGYTTSGAITVSNPISNTSGTIGLKYDNSTVTLNGSNQVQVNPNLTLTTLTSPLIQLGAGGVIYFSNYFYSVGNSTGWGLYKGTSAGAYSADVMTVDYTTRKLTHAADVEVAGTLTQAGNAVATQSWVTSQGYTTSASIAVSNPISNTSGTIGLKYDNSTIKL